MPRLQQKTSSSTRAVEVTEVLKTSNTTPTVIFSIPVAEGTSVNVSVRAHIYTPDFSQAGYDNIVAPFKRALRGNILRATANNGLAKGIGDTTGDFTQTVPNIDLVANPVKQTVDIVAIGKSTPLNWILEITTLTNQL